MQTATNTNDDTVKHLNSFLRGELSAVETYRQALNKLDDLTHRATLEACSRSHQERVQLLTQEIRRRGGDPARESGPWGAFAKLVEGGAVLFGDKSGISALEEGEDHGRDDYRRDIGSLDAEARRFVEGRILLGQVQTHGAMRALKKALS
jgi:hypothetical protein